MKSASAAMKGHLAQTSTTLNACFRLALTNGTVIGFTDHDQDVKINDTAFPNLGLPSNLVTYSSATGHKRSNVSGKNDLSVDNVEIDGVINLSSDLFTTANVQAGLFDSADLLMFICNPNDTTMGVVVLRRGNIGEVSSAEVDFKAELLGLLQRLTRYVIRLYIPSCDADFCDTRCKLSAVSFTETGTVTAVLSQKEFTATITGARPNGWATNGAITWTSGNNNGLTHEVKQQNGTDILMPLSANFQIQIGDTFSLLAGCNKTQAQCIFYNNIINFRGFPFIPGLDAMIAVPGVLS